MAKITKTAAENDVTKIRDDIQALQKHLGDLRSDMTAMGKVKAAELKERAKDNVSYLQDYGRDQFKYMEENIKSNPAKSVAIAFTAGLLTSFLFSGRK
tara:strand:+ start:1941 stop:2234 length:294 start_codon:yes stop_codon:yes gene_type:complete